MGISAACGGGEQAQGAGAFDGLVAAVRTELGVQVAHVGLDRVRRDVQFGRDLRHGQIRGQVAQHAEFAVAQRLEQPLRPGGRRRGHSSGEQAADLHEQRGVRGAVPGVALEEARRGMEQERPERAVGLRQVQRALEGAPGGGRVAERVPGDRLQQESLSQPGPPRDGSGAVQDRREGGGGRVRVVLGEPQRRGGNADLPVTAARFAEVGQDLPGAFGLAQSYQG